MISDRVRAILLCLLMAVPIAVDAQAPPQRRFPIQPGQLSRLAQTLPDFRNKPYDEAVNNPYVQRFRVNLIRETDYNSTVAAGIVTRQEPDPQTIMSVGMTVRLWVAEPPPVRVFQMPNFVGQRIERVLASPFFQRLKLRPAVEEVRRADTETGIVLSHDPPEGAEIQPGSFVRFQVAREAVVVPPVVTLPFEQARELIAGRNLIAVRESRLTNDSPAGSVVDQDPEAGKLVDLRTEVRLTVAEPLEVPTPGRTQPETPIPDFSPRPPDYPPPPLWVDLLPWVAVIGVGGAAGLFILRLMRRKPGTVEREQEHRPKADALEYRFSSEPGQPLDEIGLETPSLLNLEIVFQHIHDDGEQSIQGPAVLVREERIDHD